MADNTYNSSSINTVEMVRLMSDIKLPDYDKRLDASLIDKIVKGKHSYYRTKETEYHSVVGKFTLPIESPTMNTNSIESSDKAAPNTKNGGNKLNVSKYSTTNIIKLRIPKYIVMMFDNVIPKGTKFLIACLGGNTDIDKMRIICLYDDPASQLSDYDSNGNTVSTNKSIKGGAK